MRRVTMWVAYCSSTRRSSFKRCASGGILLSRRGACICGSRVGGRSCDRRDRPSASTLTARRPNSLKSNEALRYAREIIEFVSSHEPSGPGPAPLVHVGRMEAGGPRGTAWPEPRSRTGWFRAPGGVPAEAGRPSRWRARPRVSRPRGRQGIVSLSTKGSPCQIAPRIG